MKRIITIISLFLVFALSVNLTGCKETTVTEATREGHARTEPNALGSLESFSFSLTWDVYGISSYDSVTGRLVKTTDATNPDDYITTCYLSEFQTREIYNLIAGLDILSYPDSYDPHDDGLTSQPSMTLILSVKTDTLEKTITAANIAYGYEANNSKGQTFLSVFKKIRDILIQTEEWQSLPDYEFYYD